MRYHGIESLVLFVSGVCGLILLAGCARSQPSQHYTLAARATRAETESAIVIGVGPVTVPLHLRQPSMVARRDPYTLSYLDFHQWAQPLEDGIPQVLGENLMRLTGATRVVRYPWPRSSEVTHQISLRVLAFELDPEGNAVFEARWTLRDGAGDMLDSGLISLKEDAGGDPATAAAALSEALLTFAEDLQSRIQP